MGLKTLNADLWVKSAQVVINGSHRGTAITKNNHWGKDTIIGQLSASLQGHRGGRWHVSGKLSALNQNLHAGGHVWFTSFCVLADDAFPPSLRLSPCSRIRKPCLVSQGAYFRFPSGCFCPRPQRLLVWTAVVMLGHTADSATEQSANCLSLH